MDLTPDKGLGPVEASAERAKPKGDSMGSQTVASTVSEDRHLEVDRGGESLGHEKHDGDKTPRRVWWISGAIVPITRIQCFNSIFSFIRGGHIIGITTSPIGVLISGSTGVSTNLDLITRLALHFKVNCSCFCGISFLRAACSGTDNGDASSASTLLALHVLALAMLVLLLEMSVLALATLVMLVATLALKGRCWWCCWQRWHCLWH
jgi:hypothetical protein